MQSAPDRFTATAKTLHWLIASLILSQFVTNWLRATAIPRSAMQSFWLDTHMSIGITIFILTLLRIGWRFYSPPPAPLAASRLARGLAAAGHGLLYVVTFAIPITGFLRETSGGQPAVFYGLLIPSPTGRSLALRHLMVVYFHGALMQYGLIMLLCGHIAAALWHHVILRDGTLRRMTWSSSERKRHF